MHQRAFKYERGDFKPLPVKLEHLDIRLSFGDERVEGEDVLWLTARRPLREVRLDARDLDIRSVDGVLLDGAWRDARGPIADGAASRLDPAAFRPFAFEVQADRHALRVRLPRRVPAGAACVLRIRAACTPTANILEGIYKDTTPPGCPQQYISQCQQWGFQRILPIFDDCTAKCTMVTTLEADARYTHLISNGNVSRLHNPDGRPAAVPGNPARQTVTFVNPVPMVPYLFLVAVGTWDVLADEVVYPSGRRVRLEYLVPPGRTAGATVPMRILKDSVLWQGATQAYEYPYDVYRTICMEKSNFGGMENTGNTTIVTSAALMDEWTDDRRIEYAYAIIIHEFEHNQCGSDVTMVTPFDLWLNEAFTVDVERQYSLSRFDPVVTRLDEVDAMRSPIHGPLSVEDAGHVGNVVRKGFNDPEELIDGVTYVKAAEVIRMLRLVLGPDAFRRGKDLYFSRYRGGNADSDQFFACFEEVSGRDLRRFKREWLHTIGYPVVTGRYRYDAAARRLTVTLRQRRTRAPGRRGGLFHVPVDVAAVGPDGRDLPGTARVVELAGARRAVTFDDVPRPAFVSFNRDGSFYGTFTDASATPARLREQAMRDPNAFNRVEAMRRLTDIERIRLIEAPGAAIGEAWIETWGAFLRDPALPPGLRSYLLRVDEPSVDRAYLPRYRERYAARRRLLQALAGRYAAEAAALFHAAAPGAPTGDPRDGIAERRLRAVLLRTLIEADTPDAQRLAEETFRKAANITERTAALSCLNLSSHPRRREIMEEAYQLWHGRLTAYSSYLGIVAGGIHDDVFDRMAHEEQRPTFRIEHPNHSRSLFLFMGHNNKMLWTDRGIAWMIETVLKLTPVNETTTYRLLGSFQMVDKLADDLRPQVRAALETMLARLDTSRYPSVTGRIRAFLGARP